MNDVIERIDELRKELLRLSGNDTEAVAVLLDAIYNKIPGDGNSDEVIDNLARDFGNLSEALFNLARFIEERFPEHRENAVEVVVSQSSAMK
ncbi:MAG TPA: hypothetical protein PK544_14645 [Spirochaetota bacterium]|nr:hypothetical protein [Spirochaetota bacterium]HPQ55138.1 hypothetical protein [Spirochaetota bacterium]